MKKFGIDNPFFDFMSRLGDLMILNVLFLAGSIPVVTAGASLSALYRVTLRIARKESAYAAREYLLAWKEEWKKSTLLWLFFLLTGGLLAFDVMVADRMWKGLNLAIGVLILVWMFLFVWTFPLQARFENTARATLKNALYMSVRHLPVTLFMSVLYAVPAVCVFLGPTASALMVPVYVFAGFALTARIHAALLNRIFRIYVLEIVNEKGKQGTGNE